MNTGEHSTHVYVKLIPRMHFGKTTYEGVMPIEFYEWLEEYDPLINCVIHNYERWSHYRKYVYRDLSTVEKKMHLGLPHPFNDHDTPYIEFDGVIEGSCSGTCPGCDFKYKYNNRLYLNWRVVSDYVDAHTTTGIFDGDIRATLSKNMNPELEDFLAALVYHGLVENVKFRTKYIDNPTFQKYYSYRLDAWQVKIVLNSTDRGHRFRT